MGVRELNIEKAAEQIVALWDELKSCGVDGSFADRPPTNEERQRWAEGLPWAMLLPPRITKESLASVVACIVGAVNRVLPELQPEITNVAEVLAADQSLQTLLLDRLRERLVRKGGLEEGVPQPSGLSAEALSLVVGMGARLLMRAYAKEAAAWFAGEEWRRGICPVCGNYPVFSVVLGNERARHLYCSLCGTSWRFDRFGCPFCGRSSGEEELLVWEEQPAYRIYLCSACRGYLKAFDAKWREPGDLLSETFRTLFLDLLALQEGYYNPSLEWSNLVLETKGAAFSPRLQA